VDIRILNFPDCEDDYRSFVGQQYRHLAQHSWAWQSLLANWENLTWKAVALFSSTKEIIGLIPFCITESDLGVIAMSSPLSASYAGVLHVEDCNREVVYKTLLEAFIDYTISQGVEILTIMQSPFREDIELYQKYFKPDFSFPKFYQYIDTPDFEKNINRNGLRNLKKARDHQLEIKYFDTNDVAAVADFYDILTERLHDKHSDVPYPKEFYSELMKNLWPEGYAELSGLYHNGELVTAGISLFGWCTDIYLRLTRTSALSPLGAGWFFDYETIKRGFEKKTHAVNFQSSPSKDSSVYLYKKQWGCVEKDTHYLVKVNKNIDKFLKAGKDEVAKAFPYFFVLPFDVYH